DGHASGVVVFDAEVNSDEYRVTAHWCRMMRGIDARVPQFRRDEDLFSGRPPVFMQADVRTWAKRFLLGNVVLAVLPRHPPLFMIPIGQRPRLPIGINRQIGMKSLALAFGVFI